MSEVGRCQHEPCGQVDLLPYDGYCSEEHRELASEAREEEEEA